jgi:hypothetical protein
MPDIDAKGLGQSEAPQSPEPAARPSVTKKKFDVIAYGINSFDEHLSLKPPGLLIASAVFLSRDYLLPLVLGLMSMTGTNSNLPWSAADRPAYWYLYGIPSVLMLYGWARRIPSGDAIARWAWTNGRWLLVAAAGLQCFSIIHENGMEAIGPGARSWTTAPLLITLAAIVVYLLFDRKVRDAVLDFPDALVRER